MYKVYLYVKVKKEKTMQRKITLSINEKIYRKLHFLIPKRRISKFIEESVKEKIERLELKDPIEKGFKMMGKDQVREKEALEWSEVGISEEL